MTVSKAETKFIRSVREYLHLRGALTVRVNAGMTVIGEGESRRVIRGAEKGTSDILGCYKGRFFAIETKVGKNTPTPEQQAFLQSVRDNGGIAFAAWSLDDIDAGFGWEKYR